MSSKMATEAIIYTRYSPRRYANDSCEQQRDVCEKYCEKQGYTPVEYYEDQERKGSDAERPGLWAAIDSLNKGQVLVVYKLDRLAREVYLHEVIRRQVDREGAWIEAVKDGFGASETYEQVLMRQILQAFSEYERRILAVRTRYAMLYHQRNGRRMSRHAPYGWKIDPDDPKRMIKDEYEQECLQQMLIYREEGMSLRKIAKALEEQGYKPRRSEKWHPKIMREILIRSAANGDLPVKTD